MHEIEKKKIAQGRGGGLVGQDVPPQYSMIMRDRHYSAHKNRLLYSRDPSTGSYVCSLITSHCVSHSLLPLVVYTTFTSCSLDQCLLKLTCI